MALKTESRMLEDRKGGCEIASSLGNDAFQVCNVKLDVLRVTGWKFCYYCLYCDQLLLRLIKGRTRTEGEHTVNHYVAEQFSS